MSAAVPQSTWQKVSFVWTDCTLNANWMKQERPGGALRAEGQIDRTLHLFAHLCVIAESFQRAFCA